MLWDRGRGTPRREPSLTGESSVQRDPYGMHLPVSQRAVYSQEFLDSIADGILVFDINLLVSASNQEARKLFGKVDGKHLDSMMRGCVEVETQQRIYPRDWPPRRSLREGFPLRMRVWWERFEGEPAALEMIATPLRHMGIIESVIVTLRAIAPQLALERELREFIAITSHQLRTPITTIAWYLEILLSGKMGELKREQWEFVQKAREAVLELIDNVRLVLNASQIELGAVAIHPELRDVGTIIAEEVSRMQVFASRKEQTVELTQPRTLPQIAVDEMASRLILTNLLANAIKFTPEKGSITVRITEESNRVLVAISDTGVGIPQKEQARVFSKFFRAENVFMTSTGTGLGLYVAKLLLDRVGGEIWFESTEGKGSTFTFAIPRKGFREFEGKAQLEMPARPLY